MVSCGGSGGSSSSGGSASNTIVVIGDSIGTGFGVATPYPTRIRSSTGATVISDSVNGRMTAAGAGIVGSLLNSHRPTHLVVLLGTNDAIRGDVGTALRNLQSIVNTANASGVIPILGTLPAITRSASFDVKADQISSGIPGLGARVAQVRLALGDGSTTLADGIHPNDFGQQLIANAFIGQL